MTTDPSRDATHSPLADKLAKLGDEYGCPTGDVCDAIRRLEAENAEALQSAIDAYRLLDDKVNGPDAECVHCGEMTPKATKNHWEACPAHPARKVAEQNAEMLALLRKLQAHDYDVTDGDAAFVSIADEMDALIARIDGGGK